MTLDPVTQEILASAFHSIGEEMAVVEYRSSFSPIIREMLDFNCALFDAQGRMVAHSEQIPAQLGLMQFALQAALVRHGGVLAPGDAVLTNHPYMGGTHTNDLQVFMPIHVGAELVGYAGSIAHHIDIGGTFPGTESAQTTELFHEGMIFPAIKLVDAGAVNEVVYDLIRANVRDPHSTVGDLGAQLAACKRGVERVRELCGRFGADTIVQAMGSLLDDTSARAGALFAEWPSTSVTVEGHLDDGGFEGTDPVRIRLTLTARDGRLSIDFTGTSEQVPSGMNVPLASAHAGVYFGVRCFAGHSGIRQNDGMTRLIEVTAPEGTLVNPVFPAALSARHLAVQRIADLMIEALGELLPDRAVAASHVSFPAWVFRAHDPRSGKDTLLADILGGGGGARADADGDHALDTYCSNCAILPAEITELEYPWRVERTELVDGSGGTGRFHGGLAVRRDITLLTAEADGMYYVEQTNADFAAKGRNGGGSGTPGHAALRRSDSTDWERLPGKGYLRMRNGDTVSFVSAGGGGYGTHPDGVPHP
ncbi:hydantoinase B/oxoprolinase family protein [Peterkaempfera bronchialis]|uniref:Hydantoinase B/oxoprolinase family protein n=1 Tax=Peterkaempfera bronchialis TaxID=2126346 RepID=A0A345T3N5_9ACTN|nr:hydantoinase B/oxoprolinase family protein [Peterkaempfera bronchialis]AXI80590.1 hydantoinase B/oxoprolinase family protein [Peterkaempfera bronchialis]